MKIRVKGRFFVILFAVIAIVVVAAVSCGKGDDKQTSENTESVQAEEKNLQREYKFPAASEENDLLKIATSVNDTESKNCYITFDDGPTKEVTPQVLEILKKYDVKATFFTLGKMLEENRDLAEQVVAEGHLLANHSYSHDYEKLYASSESFMDEIERTQALIDEISGGDSFKLIRFPGGSHNAGSYAAAKQTYKQVLKDKGYYYVDWNCLNGDAEASLRSPEQLVARVKETAIGKNLVILMHDATTKKTTPQALGEIIEYLDEQGYKFKRLDEVDYYSGEAENTETVKSSEMIL